MYFNIEYKSNYFTFNSASRAYIITVNDSGSTHESIITFDINKDNLFEWLGKTFIQQVNALYKLSTSSTVQAKLLMEAMREENSEKDDDCECKN